ncbi:hypothetical protein SELMODRAFT_418723 [Selaginella moellendorffii]|uniref:DM2 domain-containing protein n=1 Tax=Selaginella moellendorffii TaxID=88036 RepID=D8S6Y5_SELML|nr:upstream activation factor subunit spp27 [Selaginella moellendorffii]EFJ20015.1 hypothetical protein SELMODRAFT_418723 [Selaginella moellendorffii]|eukprot:XP_002979058.1 upstream activation factor subunit spp27 [Selaginella moellendorffii]
MGRPPLSKDVPTNSQLRRRVKAAIFGGDPAFVTTKAIRKALEKEFGAGKVKPKEVARLAKLYFKKKIRLDESKRALDEKIQDTLQSNRRSQAGTPGNNSFLKAFRLSPELRAVTGHHILRRHEAVQCLWRYIRENNLQDPSDRKMILCAGNKLVDIFKVDSINMFTINKVLQDHLLPLEEGYEDIDMPKKKKLDRSDDRPRRSNFLTPYPISEALQSFLGTDRTTMSRAEAVDRVWEYILDKDLQEPGNHNVICDDKLRELFKKSHCSHSKVSQLVNRHFIDDSSEQDEVPS